MGTATLHPPAVPELHPTRADAWGQPSPFASAPSQAVICAKAGLTDGLTVIKTHFLLLQF